jgi:hypothetical protein
MIQDSCTSLSSRDVTKPDMTTGKENKDKWKWKGKEKERKGN